MTAILTVVGLFVFLFSLFTVGLKAAWGRLVGFVITGIVIDVLIATTFLVLVHCFM